MVLLDFSDDGVTPDLLRRWAYDPAVCFMQQDEEVLLYERADLMPLLVQLAADEQCPKRAGLVEILMETTRRLGRGGSGVPGTSSLVVVVRAILEQDVSAALQDWVALTRRVLEYLFAPKRRVDQERALAMARDLFGNSSSLERIRVKELFGEYFEVWLPRKKHNEYLYVAKRSGRFLFHLYLPIASRDHLEHRLG